MRSALALAAAAAVSFAGPARAIPPVECQPPVTVGSCFVYDEAGSYTCTLVYARVDVSLGTFSQVCLFHYQP